MTPWRWRNCTLVRTSSDLTYYADLKQLCKQVAKELNALTIIAPYFNHNKRRLINSCRPSIWNFCSRQSRHFINKHEKWALRTIYNNHDSSFSEFLEMSNKSTIHIKNIKIRMSSYKFLSDISHPIMNNIFQKKAITL